MGSNPGDKKFPWGQLPAKLLQAGCSLVQWPDGEMFDYYKLFKAQSVKSVPDSVFKALWRQTVKLPPDQRPQVRPLRGKEDDDPIISSVSGTTLVSVVQARQKMWMYAGVIRDEDVVDKSTPSASSSSLPQKRSTTDPASQPVSKKRAVHRPSRPRQPRSQPIIESGNSDNDSPSFFHPLVMGSSGLDSVMQTAGTSSVASSGQGISRPLSHNQWPLVPEGFPVQPNEHTGPTFLNSETPFLPIAPDTLGLPPPDFPTPDSGWPFILPDLPDLWQ